MTEELQETRVVCIATNVQLVGGKTGESWVLESEVPGKTADQLQKLGSLFPAGRGRSIVGAVYTVRAEVEGKKLVRMGTLKRFEEALDSDVMVALRAIARADEERRSAMKAHEKAKLQAKKLAPHATAQLARIVAAAPAFSSESVLLGLMSEIRAEARRIIQAGRK